MLEFLRQGGVILWILVAISAFVIAIIIERLIYFKRIAVDETKLYDRIKLAIEKGHIDEALAICDQNLSPFASLMRTGIENRDYPRTIQKEMLEDAAAQEAPRLEKNIVPLGTISNIAPLIGLLGTVTGTMKSLGVLGKFGAVSDPSILAGGLSEALINTVSGIIVAVIATIFYNYLVSKANNYLLRLEGQVNALILMINKNRPAWDGTERRASSAADAPAETVVPSVRASAERRAKP
jgi:biopolymer transport protein ExbB